MKPRPLATDPPQEGERVFFLVKLPDDDVFAGWLGWTAECWGGWPHPNFSPEVEATHWLPLFETEDATGNSND